MAHEIMTHEALALGAGHVGPVARFNLNIPCDAVGPTFFRWRSCSLADPLYQCERFLAEYGSRKTLKDYLLSGIILQQKLPPMASAATGSADGRREVSSEWVAAQRVERKKMLERQGAALDERGAKKAKEVVRKVQSGDAVNLLDQTSATRRKLEKIVNKYSAVKALLDNAKVSGQANTTTRANLADKPVPVRLIV